MILTHENRKNQIQNPTWTGLGSNLGLRIEGPAVVVTGFLLSITDVPFFIFDSQNDSEVTGIHKMHILHLTQCIKVFSNKTGNVRIT
jgi:hypothetical protein